MAPSTRTRPSPFDRFTDASASAIASGFSAALALGPQPKGVSPSDEGADWLRNLRQASGMFTGDPSTATSLGIRTFDPEDDLSDDEDADSDVDSTSRGANGKKRAKNSKAAGEKGGAGKRGGKGNADSAAAQRKAQNRLAQREFRQRKQQYIRALEARVELLSSDHDTQVDRLRYALRGLIAENNQLRQIVASFAGFVGVQQIGGPLQQAGLSRAELEELIGSTAEKVMTDSWQNWPGAKESEALRQIRLESNLPPEGLPESTRLPEHAKANTAAANAAKAAALEANASSKGAQSTLSNESASEKPKAGAKKRKASRDASTPRQTEAGKGTPAEVVPSPSHSNTSGGMPSTAATTTVMGAPPTFSAPSDASQVMASFFAANPSAQLFGSSSGATPAGYTFTPPSFSNMPTPNTAVQASAPQDSNALLASLFGASGMAGFMNSSGPFPFAHPVASNAADGSGSNGTASQHLQRTIANVDEPEEIRRIDGLVGQLKRERERFGSGKAAEELTMIGEALHELIRQMASFRRQPSYQLPLVLEPSEIQQTRPHDPIIDALPFPGVRQNVIAQQDSLVIEDVVLSILHFSNLHPGDITEESNWELLYGFLVAYPQLVDQKTLDIANRWRATRKESLLTFDDIAPGHV